MHCLLKLAVAISLAVLTQTLLRPGGVGDEYAFMVRLYVGDHVFGISPSSPEMIDAAARLMVRQGYLSERLFNAREQHPSTPADNSDLAAADVNGRCAPADEPGRDALTCTQ